MSMKNPLTPAGIEPATIRFVAQHLNHCAAAVPKKACSYVKYILVMSEFAGMTGFEGLCVCVCVAKLVVAIADQT